MTTKAQIQQRAENETRLAAAILAADPATLTETLPRLLRERTDLDHNIHALIGNTIARDAWNRMPS